MQQPLVLALDIGTSSVRAGFYDSMAVPVRNASVKIVRSLNVTADGGSEIDADTAVAQVVEVIDALLDKTNKVKAPITHVASCAFWHSLVGVDDRGKPTTKVLSWADTRNRRYSATLKKRFDEEIIHDRTGAHFHSSYWPAKLLWLRKEFPDAFARTTRWLAFSDYLGLKLSGTPVTSMSMASGTGVFDIRKCAWDTELLRYLKVKPGNLPPIAKSTDTFKIASKYAKRWPRLKDAEWTPTIADGVADNIGSSCLARSRAALMLGTSGAMRVAYQGEPPTRIPEGLWCYRVDGERVIIGGALSDGGGLYRWLTDNLKLPKDAESKIADRGATAHGLAFLPFLAGERSTGYHESAKAAILGLTTAHDAIDILQAAMESVAHRLAAIHDALSKVVKIKEIVASGGALRESTVWTQIIADVLGRDLTLSQTDEPSSRGAVLLALESIDAGFSVDDAAGGSNDGKVGFTGERHAAYKKARLQHENSYHADCHNLT